MKLKELFSHYLVIEDARTMRWVDTLAEAQGIQFRCPVCWQKNQGPVGTHSIICWFANRGVPDDYSPGPGRWNPEGTGVDDLTFVAPGATSVFLTGGGCGAHFHITNGEITGC